MEEAIRISAASPAPGQADLKSPPRFEHALELLLTHRGNPVAGNRPAAGRRSEQRGLVIACARP